MNLIFLFVILMHIEVWHRADSIESTILNFRWWWSSREKLNEALLYNPETEQLEDIINEDNKTKCIPCITACPAENLNEQNFIKDHSPSENGVFLRGVYDFKPGDVQNEVCKIPFEPTILFNQATFTFETGYELFYPEDNKAGLKFNGYSYDNFQPISKATFELKKPEPTNVTKTFELIGEKNRTFYWIPVLSLNFMPEYYKIRASFKKDAINDYRYKKIEKCSKYDLGSDIYRTSAAKMVDFFKSKNDRLGMFDKLYVPMEIKPDAAINESPYLHPYGGLERGQIVPLIFLHSGAAKNATCTMLNSVPIWTSILDGHLKRIDRYLYTIYRMWPSEVNIIFGVSDRSTVTVPDNWKMEKTKFERNKSPKPFDVNYPKIIYRVVEFSTGTPEQKLYAVVIIHNDRTVTKRDQLCKYTNDDWTFINNDDPKTGYSYVCSLTKNIAEKLGVYASVPKHLNDLQLSNMNPQKVRGKLKGTDERERILAEMKEFFGIKEMPFKVAEMSYDDDFPSVPADDTKEGVQFEPWLESNYEIQKQCGSDYEYPKNHLFWIIDETVGEDTLCAPAA